MSKDERGRKVSDEKAEAIKSANMQSYDLIFKSSEVVGRCSQPDCSYPLTIASMHYTSEFGDLCSVCFDMLNALKYECSQKARAWFAEAHRLWVLEVEQAKNRREGK